MAVTPQLGDFGVVYTNRGNLLDRFCSWCIRWGCDSHVNHAFLYAGNGTIIEARARVRYNKVSAYDNITWSTGHFALTDHERAQIVKFAHGTVGLRYNTLDIIAIGLYQARLGHLVDGDEWWVKRLSNDHMYICSQLVDAAWLAAGIDLFPGRLDGLVSPGDLFDRIEAVTERQ